MKKLLLFFLLGILISGSVAAQDDLYFSPGNRTEMRSLRRHRSRISHNEMSLSRSLDLEYHAGYRHWIQNERYFHSRRLVWRDPFVVVDFSPYVSRWELEFSWGGICLADPWDVWMDPWYSWHHHWYHTLWHPHWTVYHVWYPGFGHSFYRYHHHYSWNYRYHYITPNHMHVNRSVIAFGSRSGRSYYPANRDTRFGQVPTRRRTEMTIPSRTARQTEIQRRGSVNLPSRNQRSSESSERLQRRGGGDLPSRQVIPNAQRRTTTVTRPVTGIQQQQRTVIQNRTVSPGRGNVSFPSSSGRTVPPSRSTGSMRGGR